MEEPQQNTTDTMAEGTPTGPQQEDPADTLATQHKLKLKPPTYDGNYSTFEEWKYKFTAYMGIQDPFYPRMLERASTSQQHLNEADLRNAAATAEEADKWIQLDQNLKYILISITTAAAATVCRQHQHEIGLEVYRALCNRFSIPTGTRSIGTLTRLLKPTFDTNNFEESFSNWEFELNRYERDNTTRLPDQVKIAILMNETTGQLQQHLHLNASNALTYAEIRTVITEYYKTATAFTRMQQNQSSSVSTNMQGGPAPMDIGALHNKGKYKGKNKGKGKGKSYNKGKGKGYKGKGYNNQGYYQVGKGKGKIGQGVPFKGMSNNKGYKGKGKSHHKGKAPTQGCYRCGQPGHIARDCRVGVHNLNDASNTATETYTDTTDQWYQQSYNYDNYWWNSDQTMVHAIPQQQQQQQLALPPSQQQQQQEQVPVLHIGAIRATAPSQVNRLDSPNTSIPTLQQVPEVQELMIDSGAATHVCPTWFAPEHPTYPLQPEHAPQLRTATEDPIAVFGYKWVYIMNDNQQPVVIPFYVCEVSQPILSVTRLAEQGFQIVLSDHPRVTHPQGFAATLTQKQGLYFLPAKITTIPETQHIDIHDSPDGIRVTISPVTLTPTGAQWVTHNNDIWMYNNQGYLVRLHKRQRKALFTPDKTCPVPEDKLESYRKTIVHKADGTKQEFEEKYKDLPPQQRGRRLPGATWSGETWFKVKADVKPPKPPLPKTVTTPTAKATPPKPPQAAAEQQQAAPAARPRPLVRHTGKQPQQPHPQDLTSGPQQPYPPTGISDPREMKPTGDYWIKEGHMWKRVHILPRTQLYTPQQTHDGPDVTKLLPERTTLIKPIAGTRTYRHDDDWTQQQCAEMSTQWTGSTNFEESHTYKGEYIEDQEEEQQPATKARGVKTPQQPTAQERAEHQLTHLPYRTWCPTCVKNKGRADNHPKQRTSNIPVVQFDFCFFKGFGEQQTTPILTGIDVETGMSMAVLIGDRQKDFQHSVQSIQAFLLECGRVQAVLNSAILQSDQEDHLIALLKAAASKMGGNITVRQSPAYSSQSQGSVERYHRTLMGQVRTLKSQVQDNYGTNITSRHPIMPWIVRHAAYLLNRYAVHADGNTSFFRRWNKENKTPLCEFGETVLYLLPSQRLLPKLE